MNNLTANLLPGLLLPGVPAFAHTGGLGHLHPFDILVPAAVAFVAILSLGFAVRRLLTVRS